ncbi:uncharacterized protein J3D65DRAFT_589495, partial [Phyllosticta citribraziliensis]
PRPLIYRVVDTPPQPQPHPNRPPCVCSRANFVTPFLPFARRPASHSLTNLTSLLALVLWLLVSPSINCESLLPKHHPHVLACLLRLVS